MKLFPEKGHRVAPNTDPLKVRLWQATNELSELLFYWWHHKSVFQKLFALTWGFLFSLVGGLLTFTTFSEYSLSAGLTTLLHFSGATIMMIGATALAVALWHCIAMFGLCVNPADPDSNLR